MDFCMPYVVQVLREYTSKVDTLVLAAQAEEAKRVYSELFYVSFLTHFRGRINQSLQKLQLSSLVQAILLLNLEVPILSFKCSR